MTAHCTEAGTENVEYYDRLAWAYDLFFHDIGRSAAEEGRWLAEILNRHGVQRLLDAGCGTGKQAIPAAKHGFAVTAADPSEAMLDRARRWAREEGVDIAFVTLSFTALPDRFAAEFDAVSVMGNSLCNLATREEIGDALVSLRRCLRAGGVCVAGIKDYASIRREGQPFQGHRVRDQGNERVLLFELWDVGEQHLCSTAFALRGQRNETEGWEVQAAATREYMLTEAELRSLAGVAGFRRVERLSHPSEMAFLLCCGE